MPKYRSLAQLVQPSQSVITSDKKYFDPLANIYFKPQPCATKQQSRN